MRVGSADSRTRAAHSPSRNPGIPLTEKALHLVSKEEQVKLFRQSVKLTALF